MHARRIRVKYIKNILKYLLLFLITVGILFCGLVLVTKIPREKTEGKLQESAKYLEKKPGIQRVLNKRDYTYLHTYADSVVLNIIFCADSNNAIKSVLEGKFYNTIDIDENTDFVSVVEKNETGNCEYARYWHGSILIIRPLLMFLNIKQIYILSAIVLGIFYIWLLYEIAKRSKMLAIITFIASVMINIFITPFCLEYYWTILLMLITSIVALKKEKQGNSKLYYLFFITGICTCFFDFLTTETLTFTVPLILTLLVRYKDNRNEELKEEIKFILKAVMVWGLGYVSMWLVKWGLSAIALETSITELVRDKALLRVNGEIYDVTTKSMYQGAILKNLYALFPINIVKRKYKLIMPIVLIIVIFMCLFDKKRLKKDKFLLEILMIILIPYVRYLILANHSYKHYFFTFRAQMVTVIGLLFIMIELIDKNKIKKFWKLMQKDIKIKGEHNEKKVNS